MAERNDYISPMYTREQVNIAGKTLSSTIPETEKYAAIEAFRIAYNWRDAHLAPLRFVRHELLGKIRSAKIKAITAARPKRMVSIRKKLAIENGHPLKLSQIQDLAGCRAVFETTTQLEEILGVYRSGCSKHAVKHTDYIANPRSSGYRGHHLILKFQDERLPDIYRGFKIELQLRTNLQHAWATTVEAVGLIRDEDLKAGTGSKEWLRLFELMGS